MKYSKIISVSILLLGMNTFAMEGEVLYYKCSACHGKQAEMKYANKVPAIINYDKEYLMKALKEYQEKKRNVYNMGPLMGLQAGIYLKTDEDIENVVDYIISLKKDQEITNKVKEVKEVNENIEKEITVEKESTNIELGNPVKGQKYFLKMFKPILKQNGTKFANLHTQEKWKELFQNEGVLFVEKYVKNTKLVKYTTNKKWPEILKDIYAFVYKYAKDSGNIPSC